MADRRQTKSKYTADRQIPGAFEGETVTRRRFMTGTANVAGDRRRLGLPAARARLRARPGLREGGRALAGRRRRRPTSARTPTSPRSSRSSTASARRARRRSTSASATRRSTSTSRRTSTTSTSRSRRAACTSGCPVRFVEAAGRFICPCHGGVYDFRGQVDGGPPVRPLDRFYTRVRNGRLEIGPRFSVNRELKRFSPRDPASRSTASASTSTPRAPRCARSRGT